MSAVSTAVSVHDPRHDAEPAGWAEFRRAARLHAPWEYALLGVESRHAQHSAALAVARVDGRIVGAMLATVVRGPLGVRLLEIHNPWLSGFPGWAFLDHVEHQTRARLVRRLERRLCRFAGPRCAGLLYRYLPADAVTLVSGLGRVVREATGTSVLENRFASVDDWITSLARSRRHSVRGQVRKIDRDPGVVVRLAAARDDLDGVVLAELVNRHRARLGRPKFDSRGPVSARYLHELVRRDDVYTLTYHDDQGRLLAFADLLDHAELPLYQHWAARSRQEGGRQHLYFDSYARLMEHVVAAQRKGLSAGRGRLDLKRSLGLETRPLWAAAVPRPVAR